MGMSRIGDEAKSVPDRREAAKGMVLVEESPCDGAVGVDGDDLHAIAERSLEIDPAVLVHKPVSCVPGDPSPPSEPRLVIIARDPGPNRVACRSVRHAKTFAMRGDPLRAERQRREWPAKPTNSTAEPS
jgi:hypothetical protein